MNLKQWTQKWKETGKKLEMIRAENIRQTNTEEAILAFNSIFAQTILNSPPKSTSGLVIQQTIFKKLRKK